LIVSEETGVISIAKNGEIDQGISQRILRHRLNNEFGIGKEKKKRMIKKKGEDKNEDSSGEKQSGK